MKVRSATTDDAPQISAIYAPIVRDTVISFEFLVPDATEMASRISEALITHPWLVCEDAGEVVGYAYAGPHRTRAAYQWSCDVSAYIADKARGRGVGSALYDSLLSHLRERGFANAFAGIVHPNAASVALHEKFGFRHLGTYRRVGFKFGAWHDVGWYQLPLSEDADTTAPPRAG